MLGVFDSGIGGLTVISEIIKLHPHVDIVYIGDTARIPWGNRSPETVRHYSLQLTRFLIKKSVSKIIIACHTASSVALNDVKREAQNLPVIGMINPAINEAAQISKSGRIGIIGTRVTINSGAWAKALRESRPNAKIFSQSCPLFVPIVEEGLENHEASNLLIDHYLHDLKTKNIDTLILACTHYPFLSEKIGSYFNKKTSLVNPGVAVARSFNSDLGEGQGSVSLFFTDHKPVENKFIQLLSATANVKINSTPLEELEHE